MKTLFAGLLAATMISPAFATDPQDLIEARQGAYKVIKYEFADQMAAMVRGKKDWDIDRMKQSVARIQNVSGILPEAFAVESTASNSAARPEIWTDQEGFFKVAMGFGENLGKLAAAVDSEDRAAIGAALKETAGSCKVCHDDYRKD